MSLPTSARLGPFVYAISDRKETWKALKADHKTHWGLTDHGMSTILLAPNMSPAMTRATLLHELLHAALFSGGVSDGRNRRTEEEWVALAAPRLLDCMDRSPGLANFLFGNGDGAE